MSAPLGLRRTSRIRLVAAARHDLLPTLTTCFRRRQHTGLAAPSSSTTGSVNEDEIAHFSRLSSRWWDEHGEFGLLHKMNPHRVDFIREKLLEITREERGEEAAEEMQRTGHVLEGLDVLDVGCGGGLLSESLARLGGRTVGIDASPSNIAIASMHASADPALCSSKTRSLTYRHTSAEALLEDPQRYDVVCSLEVVEHVDNPASFLHSCAQLVKPGGHLFLSTIARTPLSYFLTIFMAEQALRLVTPGTHTHSKYINPEELVEYFQNYPSSDFPGERKGRPWISRLYDGHPLRTEAEVRGIIYAPWKGEWILIPRSGSRGFSGWATTQCNYLFWVRKPVQ
ncbi:ubiquinone biosynthesis O-methyltransferase [Punctularia strigosozonata HHB-11173 SS5]|uniref:ubiquinone biosynthesis O-methyltransferase n=1 Tax=Punctularia strigosozonata (strain HHB-11173) TaxID=741275 RepID=UPI0004416251|nr:ubiquinone biosynthesis O-methyltransferase [Punctularia strigosozonata HHB-11173 SS5]EIN05995.1 ubiquinone biosynthesis O-methyltransferase [Punctularia strigosozonata HHB-11173 SS5]